MEEKMKITKHESYTGTSYEIEIGQNEGLEGIEIAECVKQQYPKTLVLIRQTKIVQVEMSLFICGLKIPKRKRK